MDGRDQEMIRRIIEDRTAIEAIGRMEAIGEQREVDAARHKRAQAALVLLRYAGTQEVFDVLFRMALYLD